MSHVTRLDASLGAPEISRPSLEDLILGDPEFRLWEQEDAGGGVSAGIWASTPGKWRFSTSHWEYFHMLSGISIVTEEGGQAHKLVAGDSLVLRACFRGTWEVVETTRKHYVAREAL